MTLEIIQWTGCLFVLLGYIGYSYLHLSGPILTIIANILLVVWGILLPAYGLATLNIVILCVSIWTIIKWKENKTA